MKKCSLNLLTLFSFIAVLLCAFALNATQVNDQQDVSVKKIIEQKEKSEQTLQEAASSDDSSVPIDEFERGQPRGAIAGYLLAMRAGDVELATNYLDYRNISEKTLAVGKEELARQLYVVFQRTLWVDLTSISDQHLGDLRDGLPSYRELIGKVKVGEDTELNVLLQRVPREKDKVRIWKISNATVEKIPYLFQAYSYSALGEFLAKSLPAVDFFGVMLWQWLYFLVMLAGTYLASVVFTWLFVRAIKRVHSTLSKDTAAFIQGPVAFLLAIIIARQLIDDTNVTVAVRAVMEGATTLIIAWCWVFFRFVDLLKVILAEKFVAQDKPLAVYLLRPAGTVAKLIILVVASLMWLENLGFNASTLLAGLGIGGLALALAAQKTVENIIGAITLYTSAPVKIGNFCRFGNSYGVVEEIGLRSTRIRTLERTVIYVANAKFIDMDIENFSEREKIAFRPKLMLTPDCKRENIDNFLQALKQHLLAAENIADEPLRVHFKAYTVMGLELDILAYVKTTDFDAYLNEINQLNLTILSLLEQHHCQLQVVSERSLASL
ncbi:mechanosensitive ion channel family protein [Litorilituus sediminis]|uniref:Mechanosensitive ion channel n=1 Tax=Litorilituus sediminis TaxID=718192 RepID=A0A4P6P5S0_9GAMM|nr:mechanosensitive ion channel domain-containing protein [Litorilituus sediminis]QBG36843.1 mechanosensitive ion channel [Litorilituus sediminis]